MKRRELLKLLICGACLPRISAAEEEVPFGQPLQALGCSLNTGQATKLMSRSMTLSALKDKLIETSGDAHLDVTLGKALVRLAAAFHEQPGFGFYDDSRGKNAYASRERVVQGTWGTVLYGQRMFQEVMERANDGGMAALTIAAHEFAHIAQFHTDTDSKLMANQTTVKRVELHADYLAGWYLGTRKQSQPDLKLWAAGRTVYEIGDEDFNDPQHHGTPDQRVDASEKGFALGLKSGEFHDAFEQGVRYILEQYA